MENENKTCSKCHQTKPVSEFYSDSRKPGRFRQPCKLCQRGQETDRYYNKGGKEIDHKKYLKFKQKPNALKTQRLKQEYKLTLEQYNQMYSDQNGCCFICKNPVDYNKIQVDHNHTTGQVRKLLCPKCNTFVGHVENRGYLLPVILDYIRLY